MRKTNRYIKALFHFAPFVFGGFGAPAPQKLGSLIGLLPRNEAVLTFRIVPLLKGEDNALDCFCFQDRAWGLDGCPSQIVS